MTKKLLTSIAIYKLSKAIDKLYGISAQVSWNGFLCFIILGPTYTIIKYNIVYKIVGIGESTIGQPFVLLSVNWEKEKSSEEMYMSHSRINDTYFLKIWKTTPKITKKLY